MPSEVRHLVFRAPEVVQALGAHFRRAGRPLTSGTIGDCSAAGDGLTTPVVFQMKLHADSGAGKTEEITVDSVTLVAALIMHCREKRIPLSAKAQKSLQRIGEQICLVATIGYGTDPSAQR